MKHYSKAKRTKGYGQRTLHVHIGAVHNPHFKSFGRWLADVHFNVSISVKTFKINGYFSQNINFYVDAAYTDRYALQ